MIDMGMRHSVLHDAFGVQASAGLVLSLLQILTVGDSPATAIAAAEPSGVRVCLALGWQALDNNETPIPATQPID
jgi:ribonucleotide monophosphatase NagD (HAD superfamily)